MSKINHRGSLGGLDRFACLEDFMRKHGGYRDSLALRKLNGENLSSIEEANLAVLNLKLDKLLADKESTFLQEVKANRAEVRRLFTTFSVLPSHLRSARISIPTVKEP